MGALSDFAEQKLLDHLLNKVDYTPNPATYLALFTVAPSDAGGGTEVSGGSYARILVNENASVSTPKWKLAATQGAGSHLGFLVENLNDVAFAVATANWGTIVAWGIFDAITAGNLLMWGWLATVNKLFTADSGDVTANTFTSPGHGLVNNDRVILRGGSLPTGVSADTIYYVVGAATDTFQLSLTEGGAAIDITAVGQGEVWRVDYKVVNTNDQFKFLADAFDAILR